MSKTMTLRPRISEKAYAMSQASNVYVFGVPTDATKLTVANAVAAQFDVSVTEVNIMNVKGKAKRTVRKGGRQTMGRRSDTKKAYVTLKAGDSIVVFPADDAAASEDAKPAKAKKDKK